MTRRAYGLTLLACLAGAGLALYAATRVWSVELTARAGLPDLRASRTGADIEPWLAGLAVVALAGTGALLATGGRLRRGLGLLLVAVGAGVVAGAIAGRLAVDPGAAGAGGTFWPIACGVGGAIIVGGGLTAARHGHHWPTMSARYDRKPAPAAAVPAPPVPGAANPGSGPAVSGPAASGSAGTGSVVPGPAASGSVVPGPAGSGPAGSGPAGSGPAGSGPAGSGPAGSGPVGSGAAASAVGAPAQPLDHRAAWDALDRGDDPTA